MFNGTQEQNVLNRVNGKEKSDVYQETLKSLGSTEEILQRMQGVEKIHDLCVQVIKGIENVQKSGMSEDQKTKAIGVLQRVADTAFNMERMIRKESKEKV